MVDLNFGVRGGGGVTFAGGFAQASRRNRLVAVEEERNRIRKDELEAEALTADRARRSSQLTRSLSTIKDFGTMFRENPETRNQPGVQELFETAVEQGVAVAQQMGIDPNDVLAKAEIAKQSIKLPPEKMTEKLLTTVTMTGRLMDSGVEPAVIRNLLDKMAEENPAMAENFLALADALPVSLEERAALKGRETVAAAEPVGEALRGAGVPAQTAAVASLGKTTIDLGGELGPTELSQGEKEDIRINVRNLDNTIRAIDRVAPLINEGTVGIWGNFSRDFGGFVQQLPGIKRVADLMGASLELDRNSVEEALTAGAEFEQAIMTIRNLAREGGKRLTDQDTLRIERATAVLQGNVTPEAAKTIMNDLRETVARLRQEENTLLRGGRLPEEAPAQPGGKVDVELTGTAGQRTSVRTNEDGTFDVLDASGNVIRSFKFEE